MGAASGSWQGARRALSKTGSDSKRHRRETPYVHLDPWHIWAILAMALVIGEIFTVGFVLACFAIGALVSGLLAFWQFDVTIQLLGFSAASLLAFFGVRPFVVKHLAGGGESIKTNAAALVGKRGVVNVRVDPVTGQGRVQVEGEDWWGVTEAGRAIETGERVLVLGVDGARLLVEPESVRVDLPITAQEHQQLGPAREPGHTEREG